MVLRKAMDLDPKQIKEDLENEVLFIVEVIKSLRKNASKN